MTGSGCRTFARVDDRAAGMTVVGPDANGVIAGGAAVKLRPGAAPEINLCGVKENPLEAGA